MIFTKVPESRSKNNAKGDFSLIIGRPDEKRGKGSE